jgi:hypothetical protein
MAYPVRLNDLISYIEKQYPSGNPLDHLAAAVLAGEHLGDVADHLIGHFVDQARESGTSWTDIGQRIGVSKQAAQKRFVPKTPDEPESLDAGGFARFTDQARRVIVESQEEARQAKHDYIGTEHLVLGLLHEPEALAAQAIEALGVSLDALRAAITAALGPARDPIQGHIPFTPEAKKVLELTLREGLRLGHDHIGTEHLLLGLLSREEALGAKVLIELGITKDQAETWISTTLNDQD